MAIIVSLKITLPLVIFSLDSSAALAIEGALVATSYTLLDNCTIDAAAMATSA
jgi:hypothetical protein